MYLVVYNMCALTIHARDNCERKYQFNVWIELNSEEELILLIPAI